MAAALATLGDLPQVQVGGLGGVDGAAANLEDVDLAGRHSLANSIWSSQGQAAFEQVVLPAGNGDLDKKVLPAGLS